MSCVNRIGLCQVETPMRQKKANKGSASFSLGERWREYNSERRRRREDKATGKMEEWVDQELGTGPAKRIESRAVEVGLFLLGVVEEKIDSQMLYSCSSGLGCTCRTLCPVFSGIGDSGVVDGVYVVEVVEVVWFRLVVYGAGSSNQSMVPM